MIVNVSASTMREVTKARGGGLMLKKREKG